MRLWLVVGVVVAGLAVPGVARAQAPPECLCQVFARYMDQSKALRTQWTAWTAADVDKGMKVPKSTINPDGGHAYDVTRVQGLGGRTKTAGLLHEQIKRYASDKHADQQKLCKSDPLMDKVCKAAKRCVAAAAFTIYGAYAAGERDFWKMENTALVACQVAIFTALFDV